MEAFNLSVKTPFGEIDARAYIVDDKNLDTKFLKLRDALPPYVQDLTNIDKILTDTGIGPYEVGKRGCSLKHFIGAAIAEVCRRQRKQQFFAAVVRQMPEVNWVEIINKPG